MIRLRLGRSSSTRPNLPHAVRQPGRPRSARPRLGPGPRVLATPGQGIAVRRRVQQEGHRRQEGHLASRSCWSDPSSRAGSAMLSEMRDTVGHDAARHGQATRRSSPPTTSTRRSPASRRPSTASRSAASPATTTLDDLSKGDIAACLAWAGDIVQLQVDNPDIEFALPDSRLHLRHRQPAGPQQGPAQDERRDGSSTTTTSRQVAAELAAWINYVCPVDGVQRRARRRSTRSSPSNPLIFPDETMAAKRTRLPLADGQGRQGVTRRSSPSSSAPDRPAARTEPPAPDSSATAPHDDHRRTAATSAFRDQQDLRLLHRRPPARPHRPRRAPSSPCSAPPAAARPPPCG